METAFLVWSAAPAASQDRRAGVFLPHAGGAAALLVPSGEALPQQSPPAPRPAKAKKKPSAPRKPPQRGLGVEQLERLRLQEQWRKITHAEPPLCQQLRQPALCGLSLATTAPPVGHSSPWAASGLPYHVAAARYRVAMAGGGFQVGGHGTLAEFPSSQSLQCSERCELCVRTKRLLGEKLRTGEGDAGLGEGKHPLHLFLADRMDDQGGTEVRRRRSPETELKERMFFPCSSKLGAATRAIDESSSSPSLAIGGNQLDLSLKLSF
ncbi:unnamed protein product [Spirodela intermedia]|uniref:Uncharacterized protein n=1 Tax=Spirodela intermedia TaxID=51605 RepID=A0A7I8K6U8_SPIIN|nr:unnamed protein product [Spirodela intermedia]